MGNDIRRPHPARSPPAPARRGLRRPLDNRPRQGVSQGVGALARLATAGELVGAGRGPDLREYPAVDVAALCQGILREPSGVAGEVAVSRCRHPAGPGLSLDAGAHPGTGDAPAQRPVPAGGKRRERRLPGAARRREERRAAAGPAVERAGRTRAHWRHHEERQDAVTGSDPFRGHPGARNRHHHRSQGRRRASHPRSGGGAPLAPPVRLLRASLSEGVGELQSAQHVHLDHRTGGPGAGPHARRRRHVQGRSLLHGIPPGGDREDRRRAGGGRRTLDHRRAERRHHPGAALREPAGKVPGQAGRQAPGQGPGPSGAGDADPGIPPAARRRARPPGRRPDRRPRKAQGPFRAGDRQPGAGLPGCHRRRDGQPAFQQ